MKPPQYFLYARKSTDDQSRQLRSIDDQIAELQELARRQNIAIKEILTERQTAKRPGRPVFNQMLDRIERGEAEGILAWHPDRLSRNSVDSGRIIYLTDTGKIKGLKFALMDFEVTPTGKFMLGTLFTQSKYYIDNLSENIRRGQRQKVKNGVWPTVAPIGYVNDRNKRCIIIDPERGPLIRKAFELYGEGDCTLDRLTATINGMGLTAMPAKNKKDKPLSRAQYHRLLRNPIYYGPFHYRGEIYHGTHEPIISKALFDRCQEIIRSKRRNHTRVLKPYAYRKLFHCGECGGVVTIETQKGHNYLRCTKKKGNCSQPFVREEEVTHQVNAVLAAVSIPNEVVDWMNKDLEQEREAELSSVKVQRDIIRQKLADTDMKIQRLTIAYSENVLTLDEYRQAKELTIHEKASLTEQMAQLNKNGSYWLEPTQRFVKSLSEATLAMKGDELHEKAKWLQKVGSNLKIQDRKIQFEFRGAWKTIEKHGCLAHHTAAPDISGAAHAGKSSDIFHLTERRRFELLRPLPTYRFSKPAHSTALPPLRGCAGNVSRGGFRGQSRFRPCQPVAAATGARGGWSRRGSRSL